MQDGSKFTVVGGGGGGGGGITHVRTNSVRKTWLGDQIGQQNWSPPPPPPAKVYEGPHFL